MSISLLGFPSCVVKAGVFVANSPAADSRRLHGGANFVAVFAKTAYPTYIEKHGHDFERTEGGLCKSKKSS